MNVLKGLAKTYENLPPEGGGLPKAMMYTMLGTLISIVGVVTANEYKNSYRQNETATRVVQKGDNLSTIYNHEFPGENNLNRFIQEVDKRSPDQKLVETNNGGIKQVRGIYKNQQGDWMLREGETIKGPDGNDDGIFGPAYKGLEVKLSE